MRRKSTGLMTRLGMPAILAMTTMTGCMGIGDMSAPGGLVTSSVSQRVVMQIVNNSCGESEDSADVESLSTGSVKGLTKVLNGFGVPYDEHADAFSRNPQPVTDDSEEANKERGVGYMGIEAHYPQELASGEEHSPDHPEQPVEPGGIFPNLTTEEEKYGIAMRWEYYNPDLSGAAVNGYLEFLKNNNGHKQYVAVHATNTDKWCICCPYDWGPALNLPTTGGGKYAGGRIGGVSAAAADELGFSGGDCPEAAMTECWWVENSDQVKCGPVSDLSQLTGGSSGSSNKADSDKSKSATKISTAIIRNALGSGKSSPAVEIAPANPNSFIHMEQANWQHGDLPKSKVKYIVTSDTDAGVEDAHGIAVSWYGGDNASHFIIGKDGSIIQCVPIDKIAHHAGESGKTGKNAEFGIVQERDDVPEGAYSTDYAMDAWSIGIKLVHNHDQGDYPNAQLNALDRLVSYIKKETGSSPKIIDCTEWSSGASGTSESFPIQAYKSSDNHNDVTTQDEAMIAGSNGGCSDFATEEDEEIATSIADAAVDLAGTATPDPYIAGAQCEKPTDERLQKYVTAHEKFYPGDPYWASCDRCSGAAICHSGADESFPAGAPAEQYAYCDGSDKWQKVGAWRVGDSSDMLQPGDVLITLGDHIKIFVGNEAVQKKFPGSDANMYSGSAGQHQPWCYNESTSYDQREYAIFRCIKPDNGSFSSSSSASGDRGKIIEFAKSQLGVPYNNARSWELDIPNQQMCCNGLTRWAYDAVGISIPAGSIDQITQLPNITSTGKVSDLKPGDIVCWDDVGRRSDIKYPIAAYRHVAIYVGNGEVVEETPPKCKTRTLIDNEFSFGGSFGNLGDSTGPTTATKTSEGTTGNIAGGTSANAKDVAKDNKASGEVLGQQVAWLAVQMAGTGAPNDGLGNHIPLPEGMLHQEKVKDPRLNNAYAIHDATLRSHRGNMAIASCTQAVCAAAAAVVDMDMCPIVGGASAHPDGMQAYLDSHDFFQEVHVSSIDELKPGDILNSPGHTALFVGNELAQTKFPGTNCNVYEAGYHSRRYAGLSVYNSAKGYRVFRPTKRNFNSEFDDVDWASLVTDWSCDPPTGSGSNGGNGETGPGINVEVIRA